MDPYSDAQVKCLVVSRANDFVELERFQSDFHHVSDTWSKSKGIWHHEQLRLSKCHVEGVVCLAGTAAVGEAIEDEHTIVKLLLDVSQRHPGVWISVGDDVDGEFLLVDAAAVLPRWLTPDNAKYRVWLRDGKLWLLDKEADREDEFNFGEVVKYLRRDDNDDPVLVYNDEINRIVLQHIQDGSSEQHIAVIALSRKSASFLHRYEFYISAAYRALFATGLQIGEIAVTASRGSSGGTGKYLFRSPLSNPQIDDPVEVPVRFSRRIYAAFKIATNVSKPLGSNSMDLGTKVTVALELMFQAAEKSQHLVKEMLDTSLEFQEFAKSCECLRGIDLDSNDYARQMEEAKEQFLNSRYLSNQVSTLAIDRLNEPEMSDAELDQWKKELSRDSDDWLRDMQNIVPGDNAEDDDALKDQLEDIFLRVKTFMEDEEADLDGIDNGNESKDEQDPKISEDDFFEFFLQQALKLTPEEIESYAADDAYYDTLDSTDEDCENSDEDEDEEVVDEDEKFLSQLNSLDVDEKADSEFLRNLASMIREQGQISGPTATLLGQLGLDLENVERSVAGSSRE